MKNEGLFFALSLVFPSVRQSTVYSLLKIFMVWHLKAHSVSVYFFRMLIQVFYTEVLESIRHGVADCVDPENIILEINASK